MVNKKAQAQYAIAFMLAVCVVILGLAFAYPLNEMTTTAMNETGELGGMNCTGTTDDFTKAGCWTVDLGQGFFIGSIIAIGGIVIASRIIWG